MKVAISGKGGVGKTTLTTLLAKETSAQGHRVFVIDADPNPNLALALGIRETPRPLVELKDLIEERIGALEGFFRLNPRVDDIPDEYSIEQEGIRLLVMGGVRRGGAGCACPENAFLRSLLEHVIIARDEWVFVDLEAGLEHLGRATAQAVDALLIVVEPDLRSLETVRRIQMLAAEIGLSRFYAVGNKICGPEDVTLLTENLNDIALLASLPESLAVRHAAQTGCWVRDPELSEQARAILNVLQHREGCPPA